MTALLETRGVWQRFGGLVANSDVSISVQRGEIVGLIGPNGAGKSTLFNLIAGVRQPTEGTIHFDGKDVTATPATERCRAGIARTFQVVMGLTLLSYAVNLFIFSMGSLSVDQPPIVAAGRAATLAHYSDPMPQALVLTAIVIGFATTALFLVVLLALRGMTGTDHVDGREPEA